MIKENVIKKGTTPKMEKQSSLDKDEKTVMDMFEKIKSRRIVKQK